MPRKDAAGQTRRQTLGGVEKAHRSAGSSVCVQNISAATTATQIEVALRVFGTVKDVCLKKASRKGESTYAIVEFETEADAARCLRRTDSSRPDKRRHKVSVNGRQLQIQERPTGPNRQAGASERKTAVDASLSSAQNFLADMEEQVARDVEAGIVAAGGCIKCDDIESIVDGRLTTKPMAWLRGKPHRFSLCKDARTGGWVVKERIGARMRACHCRGYSSHKIMGAFCNRQQLTVCSCLIWHEQELMCTQGCSRLPLDMLQQRSYVRQLVRPFSSGCVALPSGSQAE